MSKKAFCHSTAIILFASMFLLCPFSAVAQEPEFVWAREINSPIAQGASVSAITLDPTGGNFFVTGGFSGNIDFDPGPGSFSLVSNPGGDSYFLKMNTDGGFSFA